ncbi:hypothetical protein FQA39_LY08178 [Lamprigera yunnana]|nr:hypothetical protein FQA39_LY08178 [Lamprigera yunnana]
MYTNIRLVISRLLFGYKNNNECCTQHNITVTLKKIMEIFQEYQHILIEEVCCICFGKKEQMNFLFDDGLPEMLLECASINLSDEDSICLVCKECKSEISRWYVFKKQLVKCFEIGRWLMKQKIEGTINVDRLQEIDVKLLQKENLWPNLSRENLILSEESTTVSSVPDSSYNFKEEILDQPPDVVQSILERNADSELNSSPIGDLTCESCHKRFSSFNALQRHYKTHSVDKKYECPKCNKVFKQSQTLSDHIKRHYNNRNYACEVCEKKFYKHFNVTEHMRIHTGERPFKCQSCDSTFTRAILLRNHIKKAHTGETKFVCEVCLKCFVDNYQLKIHMRVHTGEKPFLCQYCDKSFAMRGQLKSHTKYRHTYEKNFICNVCARAFTAKHTLEEHLRTHTGEKKEPRHTCNVCGKKCITTTQLKIHIRSAHTGERPFKCTVCDKAFVTRSAAESHMRSHTGGKSFVCSRCGKTFSANSSLKIHERTHTGERPYKCDVCGKSFAQRSTLKTHLKIH